MDAFIDFLDEIQENDTDLLRRYVQGEEGNALAKEYKIRQAVRRLQEITNTYWCKHCQKRHPHETVPVHVNGKLRFAVAPPAVLGFDDGNKLSYSCDKAVIAAAREDFSVGSDIG